MIGGISKKLLAKIVSWASGVISLLGFIFFAFPAMNESNSGLTNYTILSVGLNPYNDVPSATRAVAAFDLIILICLCLSLVATVFANLFVNFSFTKYVQTGLYALITLFSFLLLTVNEGQLSFPLTMGFIFLVLALLNAYFNFLFAKGKLVDPA